MEDFAVEDVFKVGQRDINCVEWAAKAREAGTKLVDDATAVIEAYPEVARA